MRTICLILTVSWMTAAVAFLQGATAIIPLDAFSDGLSDAERHIEARHPDDIAADNEIALAAKRVMAAYDTIHASVEVHERRLLVTGLFRDRRRYHHFHKQLLAIDGVERIYWHVELRAESLDKRASRSLPDWGDALVLDNKAANALATSRAVSNVNFRIATDARGTVYLIGRARSAPELTSAVRELHATTGITRLVQYVSVNR